MTAADIRHLGPGLQFIDHAFKCRQPLADQMRAVAGPEETLGAAEHAGVVITPGKCAIAAHGRDQFVLVMEQ
ncbi:hypothetical protein D3C80_1953550 [compost metagenome]